MDKFCLQYLFYMLNFMLYISLATADSDETNEEPNDYTEDYDVDYYEPDPGPAMDYDSPETASIVNSKGELQLSNVSVVWLGVVRQIREQVRESHGYDYSESS